MALTHSRTGKRRQPEQDWSSVLIDLDDASRTSPALTGFKAERLAQLRRKGLPVLPGFVVEAAALVRCVEDSGLAEAWARAEGAPLLLRHQLRREVVERAELPEGFRSLLAGRAAALGETLAVRSSALVEDAADRSLAGFLVSEIGVVPDQVALAVKRCWASAYSGLLARFQPDLRAIPVLVQPAVRPDKSGVFFSRDPTGDAAAGWIVEAVRGHPGQLVGGKVSPDVYRENEGLSGGGVLTADDLRRVVDLGRRVESLCHWPADVEWAFDGGDLMLLQARPITGVGRRSAAPPPRRNVPYLVDIDDADACGQEDLAGCRDLHVKWYDKHHWIRMAARRHGISVSGAGYLFFRPERLDPREIDRLVFPGPVVKVSDGRRTRTFGRKLLAPFLRTVPAASHGVSVVKIEQVSRTEMCGFARRSPDGCTLIEAIPGAFGGFRRDTLPFTVYLVSRDGQVVRHEPKTYERIWVFNEALGRFAPKEVEPRNGDLTPGQLGAIEHLCRSMSDEFGTVTVEWVYEEGRLDLFDLSFEAKSPNLSRFPAGTIAAGRASGPCIVFDAIPALRRLLSARSVIPEPDYYAALERPETKALLRNLTPGPDKPIVVAKYPDPSLSLLTGSVAGFIFDRGAVLCHLAIILREEGIPAAILPEATRRIGTGAWVQIEDGQVTWRSSAGP